MKVMLILPGVMGVLFVVYASILLYLHYRLKNYSEFIYLVTKSFRDVFKNKTVRPAYDKMILHYFFIRRKLFKY